MSLDPATVTADELDPRGPHTAAHRIVGRYPRAVVIESDRHDTGRRYTVFAIIDADSGPYDRPHEFRGLTEKMAHDMARDWARLAR
jgi:hypothetical protein